MSLAPSYIRFEETYKNLDRCAGHMWDKLSSDEAKYRLALIRVCQEIAEEFPDEDSLQSFSVEEKEE